jgi:hypothetical protein
MTLQVVASPTVIILMTLEAPTMFTLMALDNIYGTGVTYDRHLRLSKCVYSRGHRKVYLTLAEH